MRLEDMLVADVDLLELGHSFFKLPLIAYQLGHQNLEKTDTYLHPTTAAGQFMIDVMMLCRGKGMSTDLFVEKWFGGDEGALMMLQRLTFEPVEAAA